MRLLPDTGRGMHVRDPTVRQCNCSEVLEGERPETRHRLDRLKTLFAVVLSCTSYSASCPESALSDARGCYGTMQLMASICE